MYRGTEYLSLARTFKTAWGGAKKIRSLLKKDAKARTGCCQEDQKKHIASENMSCGYFTLLVQHEFAGGLADRCAEETGKEGMILET